MGLRSENRRVKVALPPSQGTVPRVDSVLLKVTVPPVGTAPNSDEIVAVKVTGWLNCEGLTLAATTALVLALLTTSLIPAEELVIKPVLPTYSATMVWDFTVNVEMLKVAFPLARVPVPTSDPLLKNSTEPFGAPERAALTVAVKVTFWP